MCSARKNFCSRSEVLDFTYPTLHTGKTWYIDFMAFDPAVGKMRRKKYMLNGIDKISERKRRAAEIIEAVTRQLRNGWSPWVHLEDNRGYILLDDALDKYELSIEKLAKYKTRKSYSSRLTIFRKYISTRVIPPKYVYQFDTALISDFLDWIYLDRECGARTRNNYRGWCSSLANFLIERQYIASNPVEKIRTIDETPKKRQPLTPDMLRQMAQYLRETDSYFLLACQMEYYTFIRPTELSYLTIGDISVKEQSVFIAGEVSKNKRDGKVGLNSEIVKLMIDLGIFRAPSHYYLFGHDMRPNKQRASSETFRRKWKKLREALGWGDEYQFYSLKDSGIRDLANSEGIIIARDQARHRDVTTTNKYLQGRDIPVHPETKKFTGSL